jgi:hypothetical protein
MFRDLDEQRDRIQEAAVENGRKETLAAIYAKYPQLIICTANDKAVIRAIQEWVGDTVEILIPSPTYFEAALAENGEEFFKQFATQSIESAREEAISEILRLLKAGGSGYDEFNLATERTRLQHFTLDAVRVRLADIRTKQKMASLPLGTLKQFVADSRKDGRKYPGYPDLPPTMWDPEKGQHVAVNSEYLKNADGWLLRKWNRLYSVSQVNDRLNGR